VSSLRVSSRAEDSVLFSQVAQPRDLYFRKWIMQVCADFSFENEPFRVGLPVIVCEFFFYEDERLEL